MPTDRSISLSLVSLPPPKSREQIPISSQAIFSTKPSLSAQTGTTMDAFGRRSGSVTAAGSPPWASTNCSSFRKALPSLMTFVSIFLASSTLSALLPASNIRLPSTIQSSLKSSGPSPRRVAMASFTSRALPTARPSG